MEGHETLYIYGDGAYHASYGVAVPWEDPRGRRWLPQDKQNFNKALSSVRIAVEQCFGCTQVLWTYTAFNKGLTAGWQPVAVHFIIAILLTNCHTCLRSTSSAGSRFLVPPPSVEDYLLL
jgi:nuclease HARBI1